uniref:Uncharacterized protein n=1 Tax=uncultured organism TaxID=155900 RepID=A0A7L9QC46_9ZZZZ|nr:hypothetical protein [uncultured organism]
MTDPKFIDVLRLEHVDCERLPNHGPYYNFGKVTPYLGGECDEGQWHFGGRHAGPGEVIRDYEHCGVTWAQLPHWAHQTLEFEDLKQLAVKGWAFVRYVVPCEELRVYRGQALFPTRHLYRADVVSLCEIERHLPAGYMSTPDEFYDQDVHTGFDLLTSA